MESWCNNSHNTQKTKPKKHKERKMQAFQTILYKTK